MASASSSKLNTVSVVDLRTMAKALGISSTGLRKSELVAAIFANAAFDENQLIAGLKLRELEKQGDTSSDHPTITARSESEKYSETSNSFPKSPDALQEDRITSTQPLVSGPLDVLPEGYGFLRAQGYHSSEDDVYVAAKLIRSGNLRAGDMVAGPIRPPRNKDKFAALASVVQINGVETSRAASRRNFAQLTPLFPDERLRLEQDADPGLMIPRIVDLLSPIGKGQRGLIVSPPKAGKTTVLQQMAQAISKNNPECHLMVVLVDERPEEVTDMERTVNAEVISSTFDRPAYEHTQIAELAIERAKRLVESGKDVVILLDSITRLARAYNLSAPASGRILSGGVDSAALYPPKRFFGAARNIEEGGSLTILATALIETGSKMDEVIFEEFKGTGNMELRLDRKLADKRIYPAISVEHSGTRHEELLMDRAELQSVWKLRRVLAALESTASLELLIDRLADAKSNTTFLTQIAKNSAR